nr:hypothetical protein [Tanacetum cinerariifolium]
MENYDIVPTPMVEQAKLKLDLVGKPVDHIDYRSMIGSLMYVTSSRPDIMFVTYMSARYQANPNEHHVSAVKRSFIYVAQKKVKIAFENADSSSRVELIPSKFDLLKTGLGFDSQVFNSQVCDYEELHSHESIVPKSLENDRYKIGEGCHVVPPPYTGTFMPPKPNLVFTDDPNAMESVANVFNVESRTNKPNKDMSKTLRPDASIVEDWIFDSEDETEIESVPKQREPSFLTSTKHVKSSRESVKKVEHPKQAKTLRINNQQSRDIEEIDGGYVAFRGNHKGGKISGKGKIKIVKKVNDVVQLYALIIGEKVIVLEDIIRGELHLDDADGVECLTNEDIFEELARMGYEKPPPKLTFYKAFFYAQWKFLIHTFVYVVRNVDSPSKFLMYPRFVQVVMDHQVDDMTSHNTRYTSPALTQKVFANMRRDPTPIPHDTPPQDQPSTPHASPPHEQPTTTYESSMSFFTTLMETCATLSQKVAELEQDKHSQALEILQLKKRVKKLEKKKKSKSLGFKRLRKIEAIDADEDITLVDVETNEEVVTMDAEPLERIKQEDVNAASKDVSATQPIVFDDEYVTMTIAQTLIKLKAEKAKLLDEQMAQKLHDEKVQKATARGMTYDKVRPIFEREYKKVQTLFKPDKDVEEPKKKRVDDIPSNDPKEMSEEDVQNMLEIVPIS